MKPKQHRAHYARKRMHIEDPDRYCKRNRYLLYHVPDGPIQGFAKTDANAAKYTGFCRHCGRRIEAYHKFEHATPGWDEMEWRLELYVIEELPF